MDFKNLVLMILALLAVMWAAKCTTTITRIWQQLQHADGYVARTLVVEDVTLAGEMMPDGEKAPVCYLHGDITIDGETHRVRVNATHADCLRDGHPLPADSTVAVLHNPELPTVEEVGGVGHVMVARPDIWTQYRQKIWLFAAVGYLPLIAIASVVVTTLINLRRER